MALGAFGRSRFSIMMIASSLLLAACDDSERTIIRTQPPTATMIPTATAIPPENTPTERHARADHGPNRGGHGYADDRTDVDPHDVATDEDGHGDSDRHRRDDDTDGDADRYGGDAYADPDRDTRASTGRDPTDW